MPRLARMPVDGLVYHVLNRGNCRMNIFEKPEDFAAFIKLLEQARRRVPTVRVLGYCLMHNHWHLVLWPAKGADLSRFMGWLSSTHVRRWREHRGNVGLGHLYQGRYKSFIVQDDEHLLTVLRYVEANPLRANIVARAQDWLWSSLVCHPGMDGLRVSLSPWPVDRPRDWAKRVNDPLEQRTLQGVRTSIARGRPLGEERWVAQIVKRLKLESTLRDPWRPKQARADTVASS